MKNKEGEIINGIIYGSRNIVNGKWYIGQSINYKQRKYDHLRRARHNYDRCIFHAAIRKYGEDAFEWTLLESDIHTYDELNEREKYWIREKKSLLPNGYNMTGGGDGTANHHKSEETRKRISIANKGKKRSEETRKRISIANKGKKLSEETRKRISIAHMGLTASAETRKRLSIVNKGKGAKPVLMFNRNGDFVAEFPSIKDAADYIGITRSPVAAVLNGTQKFAGSGHNKNAGYTFRYKNENPDR